MRKPLYIGKMRRSEISFITLPVIVWQVLVGGTNERQNGHKLTIPSFFYFFDFQSIGRSALKQKPSIYIQLYLKFLKLISTRARRKMLSENDVQNCMGFSSKLRFSLFGIFLCGFSAELVEMLDERLTVFCPNQQFVRASQKVSFPSSKI